MIISMKLRPNKSAISNEEGICFFVCPQHSSFPSLVSGATSQWCEVMSCSLDFEFPDWSDEHFLITLLIISMVFAVIFKYLLT